RDPFMSLQAEIYNQELDRMLNSPFFNHIDRDNADTLSGLNDWVQNNLMLTSEAVIGVVENSVQNMFKLWNTEPISLKAASENPDPMAEEIFKRARALTPGGAEGSPLPLEVIAQVCDGSDLTVISSVVLAEKEFGRDELNPSEFARLTRRYLLLKERYRIGRWTGRSGNLDGLTATPPVPVAPAPAPALAPDLAAPVKPEPVVFETPVAVPQREAAPIPTAAPPKPAHAPVELDTTPPSPMRHPIPAPATPAPAVASQSAGTSAPPLEVLPENKPLFNTLMDPELKDFFTETFFKYDLPNVYEEMILRITQQNNLTSATIIADNELFLREVSNISDPAEKLFDLLKDHFGE
ncbi:hypothetical protein ACFLQJ_02955, partial [Calditrichota bacterium]